MKEIFWKIVRPRYVLRLQSVIRKYPKLKLPLRCLNFAMFLFDPITDHSLRLAKEIIEEFLENIPDCNTEFLILS